MDFPHLHEPALSASVDLLVLVVFGDPSKDSMFKAVDGVLRTHPEVGEYNQTI